MSPVFTNGTTDARNHREIQIIQDQVQAAFNNYINSVHPMQPLRFGKLLLFLPALRNVSNNTIEELFFRKTIGSLTMDRLLSDIYKDKCC